MVLPDTSHLELQYNILCATVPITIEKTISTCNLQTVITLQPTRVESKVDQILDWKSQFY